MLGVAMRTAQRMGIHNEAANAKYTFLEAEMRRRLWWSLVLFDARIAEMTDWNTGMLIPTWDCKVPLNVNDFDLRPEMKNSPMVYTQSSESIFAVVRSTIGDAIRHSPSHLDFVNPVLKALTKSNLPGSTSGGDELAILEKIIENTYLQLCDPDNPLHFMTMWTARVAIAKSRFTHYLSTYSQAKKQQVDDQRNIGITYACTMLECDTKLMGSPLIKGYRWIVYLHFPFPAYVFLVEDLTRRPFGDHAAKAWQAMSENCSARFMDIENKDNPMERTRHNPFFHIFAGLILKAWNAREAASTMPEEPPLIVTQVRARTLSFYATSQGETDPSQTPGSLAGEELRIDQPMTFGSFGSLYTTGSPFTNANAEPFSSATAQSSEDFGRNAWGWPNANWNPMARHGW